MDMGDVAGAREWYERAANAGDSDAMVNLGDLLKQSGDVAGAHQWWQRAANSGDSDVMRNLENPASGVG